MGWLGRGWQVFPAEPAVLDWVAAARGPALAAVDNPALRARWLRHAGTWFAGVDVLPNDADGRVGQGPPLAGAARDAAEAVAGRLALHPAQVSVTWPGYPGRDEGETDTAHAYRLRRDAAHLDGLLPEGPDKRRHLREPHGYILGLALTGGGAGAAPLVVWEGSHEVMRGAFRAAFAGVPPGRWGEIDVTATYQAARRRCFDTCARVELPLAPGEAVLLHRLSLHGIAPWTGAAAAPRAIAYLRPLLPRLADWLDLP
ncbi:hypothetical protein [Roseicyclus persicicus]|uniref:Phytanoyl-CoA dioxygenase n=1 Tax=Roseicyclus persicicus TaxID=2650661 RepID=A0A7X6K0B1_9RHOB|nr:hypothetical protein [Roseibacterium persicicum]NKX45658.1 hypothetical protein [Roseibacterium persicicum]